MIGLDEVWSLPTVMEPVDETDRQPRTTEPCCGSAYLEGASFGTAGEMRSPLMDFPCGEGVMQPQRVP